MKVVDDWPPNIEAIREVLPVTRRNIFAYHDTVYNPGGGKLGNELLAHEAVHFRQQSEIGVDLWWEKFLASPAFRLEQEIEAHQAEWRFWLGDCFRPRNERRVKIKQISKRLADPMYGGIISVGKAKKAIMSW